MRALRDVHGRSTRTEAQTQDVAADPPVQRAPMSRTMMEEEIRQLEVHACFVCVRACVCDCGCKRFGLVVAGLRVVCACFSV